MSYGLSCQCDGHMAATCSIPGNETYLALVFALLLTMIVLCTRGGGDDDDDEDDRPSGMYN